MSNNPSFQHRHYAKIAAVIRQARSNPEMDQATLYDLQEQLANLFADDNPRFDRSRFANAATPNAPVHGKDYLTAHGQR